MLDISIVLELSKDIVLRSIGEKYWALNVSSGTQYKLNEVSYFVLDQFRNQKSVEQIIENTLVEYDVTREQFMTDCIMILQFAIDNLILQEVRS